MTDDTLIEIQNALIRKLAPWLVAGVVGSSVVGGSGVFRFDKFGRSDFNSAMSDHMSHMEKYVEREIEHAVILIEAGMPPSKTKAKIRALESSAERVDPEFQAVYEGW